jgi:DNA helicase-2/ATP-dependent DNA helicase PcrA
MAMESDSLTKIMTPKDLAQILRFHASLAVLFCWEVQKSSYMLSLNYRNGDEMVHCQKCGAENPADSLFCRKCGKKFIDEKEFLIDWSKFEIAVVDHLGRNIREEENHDQNEAIRAPIDSSLFIVAGPGSGKTTVIALRILKLIFVDGINPSCIIATTFTRRAAAELRSRILGWGDQLRRWFINSSASHLKRERLRKLDLNRIIIGTLDEITEKILRENRSPGEAPPIIIEDFVSKALMLEFGLFQTALYSNRNLRDFSIFLRGSTWKLNISEICSILLELKERFFHDCADVRNYRSDSKYAGARLACSAIDAYVNELRNRRLFDFTLLESKLLHDLKNGSLNEFLDSIRFLLVDEYQDTNLLQEKIYFEIAKVVLKNGGGFTVVGDDDQSLYRFRGATVDLFKAFQNRVNNHLGLEPFQIFLSNNYRSTPVIVDFCNNFITLDQNYQEARVREKPLIKSACSEKRTDYPILGMFRSNTMQLAHDIALFVHEIIYGKGFQIRDTKNISYDIRINIDRGSPEDIAILFHSPREYSYGKKRLPLLLREELEKLSPPIQVFNPRGQDLVEIPAVKILCGLLLESIDPKSFIQDSLKLPTEIREVLSEWREAAVRYVCSNQVSPTMGKLHDFVSKWQKKATPELNRKINTKVPLIELVYKLIAWIPDMQDDIENLVYLEAIVRTINQLNLFGRYGGHIILNSDKFWLRKDSVKEAIYSIFAPIAGGAVEVNEDLYETLPRNRINCMSIHQSKGLEFPLVIVDVGSEFKDDYEVQAFKRFPTKGGKTSRIEDEIRPYSDLGCFARSGLDREFDDLIRLYFEAYSRAKDCLMLVGLTSVRSKRIPHIATGWDRNKNWIWGYSLGNLLYI